MSTIEINPDAETQPVSLSRTTIRNALRIWTFEGGLSSVQGNLVGGGFQIGFALYLGCSNVEVGVLAAIPAFAGLFQLISSYFTQQAARRKQLATTFLFCGRLLWFPILLIPFLVPKHLWVSAFLILILCSESLNNVANPLFTAWITDLVPMEYRGRYFGKRNMYVTLVGIGTSIAGGIFLDGARKAHHGNPSYAFGVMFGVATIFALLSFLTQRLSPDIPHRPSIDDSPGGQLKRGVLEFYSSPFKDQNFRRIIMFAGWMAIAQTIAGQFFTVYQFKVLNLNYTWYQILSTVTAVFSMVTMQIWGYLADKYGNKPMLAIACVIILFPPVLWILAVPDGITGLWMTDPNGVLHVSYTKLVIIFLNVLAGAGWAGVGLTQFNLMIGAAPSDRKAVYVSALSAVAGLLGAISPMVGGALLEVLARVHFSPHSVISSPYHVLFLISGASRLVLFLFIPSITEVGSNSARYVLGQLRATKPIGSFNNIQKLSRSKSPQARQQAAEKLARLKSPVAVEELVRALDDASLGVREQAAVALGEIGDRRAVAPLLAKLTDPGAAITSEAARALGKIGDLDALPALAAAAQLGPPQRQLAALEALGAMHDPRVSDVLTHLIDSPEPSVRTAALRTLVSRADPVSLPFLQSRLNREHDPSVLAMLADVLGRLEAASPEHLLAVLSKSDSIVLRLAVLNAVGNLVGGPDAFYPFLSLDPAERDEAITKILTQLQRRYRANRESAARWPSARVSVLSKQALQAFNSGDRAGCISRLRQAGEILAESHRLSAQGAAALRSIRVLEQRSLQPDVKISADELMLAVFLAKQITSA